MTIAKPGSPESALKRAEDRLKVVGAEMMNPPTETLLRIGGWYLDPASGEISRDGATQKLEARTLRLLLHLAQKPGQVASIDELLNTVWAGVVVTPDSVYQAVASLRRLLGDDPKQPRYIQTVPRIGYRMVAPIGLAAESAVDANDVSGAPNGKDRAASPPRGRSGARITRWRGRVVILGSALAIAFAAVVTLRNTSSNRAPTTQVAIAPRSEQSIAVLPFLDLTEAMDQEYFADGMTEELIDKLSDIPGLRVPPARSSFHFKGQKSTIAEIATALNVAYVLDGSVRKSGNMLRVSARLVRVDDGYIVWSQTYDRSLEDALSIQEDIAAEVTQSLRAKVTQAQRRTSEAAD